MVTRKSWNSIQQIFSTFTFVPHHKSTFSEIPLQEERAKTIWRTWGLIILNSEIALINEILDAHDTEKVATENRSIWEPGSMQRQQMCRGKTLAETSVSPVALQRERLTY